MKTNVKQKLPIGLAMILIMVAAGCVQEEPTEPDAPTGLSRDKVYSDIVCPDGEIPWRFPSSGTALNSEEYTSSAEMSGDTEGMLANYARIKIEEVSCAEGLDEAFALRVARGYCGNLRECAAIGVCRDNRACSGDGTNEGCKFSDATIKYTCGDRDLDDNGEPRIYMSTVTQETAGTYNTRNEISCRGVGEQLLQKDQRDGTVACVPLECHGRARRNADMQCVVDDSKVEVVVDAKFGTIEPTTQTTDVYTEAIIKRQLDANKLPAKPFPINATYKIPLTVSFANGLVPEEVKLTAWIEDVHRGLVTANRFRCVPFAVTLRADDPHTTKSDGTKVYQKVIETKFAQDCIDIDPVKEMQDHVKQLYPGSPGSLPYLYVDRESIVQKLHLSYDMDGHSVWHKGLTLQTASQLGDSEPECTPNPVGMFYEINSKSYNQTAYFSQRKITTYDPPGDQELYFSYLYADRSEIGTKDIVARNEPVIRVFSNRRTLLTFDLSWYVNNMDRSHVFNLEQPSTRQIYGENRKYINSPRADVYLVPAGLSASEREAITPLYIGKVDLSDGKNNGKIEGADDGITQSASLVFPAVAKQKMVRDATSPHYIPGESRAFDLFYCINAWDGLLKRDAFTTGWTEGYNYYRNETRLLSQRYPNTNGQGTYNLVDTYDLAHDVRRINEGQPRREHYWTGPFDRVWSLELENSRMHNPYATPFKYRGCRTAKVPVVVYVDRFRTPIEGAERVSADVPASARIHTDFADQQDSGDTSMSGSNDTDLEETCPNNDSSDVYCSNTANSGGRSSGEGGRPALDMTTTLEREPKEADQMYDTVALKFRGQLADFMALDMSSLGGAFGSTDDVGSSRKLTFNISPDWDNIAELLNGGDPSPNTEWDEGRIGERDGLGYSIGYNLMFNIGPVPVFVTFKFTVGASVGLSIEVAVAPEDDDAYECLGESEDCYIVETTNTSFADAADACSDAGGRLVELREMNEAGGLADEMLAEGIDTAWIGAQLAYEKDSRVTEYRWLSDSAPFASDATGTVRYSSDIIIDNQRGLPTHGETGAAVFYNARDKNLGVSVVEGNNAGAHPYVCRLPYADDEVYFSWATGLALALGAGVGLEGCTPSPFVGFCLSASLNIIAAEVKPTVGQTFRWLFRDGDAFARNGVLEFSIPFTLSLFSGDVKAALKVTLLFAELTLEWLIHEFDGIKVFEVDLYKLELPVLEDY